MLITRFAPSPTGRLHLGHAYSAVVGFGRARSAGGRWLLRIDDLDSTRRRPEFVAAIAEDLSWLGLSWDGAPLVQSERGGAYVAAIAQLRRDGLIYPCFCTRADVAATLSAPHAATAHYPGTCRGLPDEPDRRAAEPHSWRLDSAQAIARAGLPSWREEDGDRFTAAPTDLDDEILARKDAPTADHPAAYHLACVVDDAASGVTLVTRGADLRASTPVQRLLQLLLDLPEPTYLHHPLVMHEDGRRLAKRDLAPTLAAMRDNGTDGPALAAQLATGVVPSGFRLRGP